MPRNSLFQNRWHTFTTCYGILYKQYRLFVFENRTNTLNWNCSNRLTIIQSTDNYTINWYQYSYNRCPHGHIASIVILISIYDQSTISRSSPRITLKTDFLVNETFCAISVKDFKSDELIIIDEHKNMTRSSKWVKVNTAVSNIDIRHENRLIESQL